MISIPRAATGMHGAQVTFAATVISYPRFFVGTTTHARHEAFDVRTSEGRRIEIVDNVRLAPPVPVVPGDRIRVRGELVVDRGGGAVVHWTHHDPAARHTDGFIDLRGRRYA